MTVALLSPSPRREKKWRVKIEGRAIDFGSSQYEDFTIHKDCRRMVMYLVRHQAMPKAKVSQLREGSHTCKEVTKEALAFSASKSEHWNDPLTPGFWSRWLLWSHPSMEAAIKEIEKRFGIKVVPQKKAS